MLTTALVGALAGGLMSLLVNEFRGFWRLKRTTAGLSLKPVGRAGSRVTARVKNDSSCCVERATAYITVHHDLDDVLPPTMHFAAFISPRHRRKLQEDRLCWSVTMPNAIPCRSTSFQKRGSSSISPISALPPSGSRSHPRWATRRARQLPTAPSALGCSCVPVGSIVPPQDRQQGDQGEDV